MITAKEAAIPSEINDVNVGEFLEQVNRDMKKTGRYHDGFVYEVPYNPKAIREIKTKLESLGYNFYQETSRNTHEGKYFHTLFVDCRNVA